ncbi:hypothetical protein MKW92_047868, partial [Papaver armeniacum]
FKRFGLKERMCKLCHTISEMGFPLLKNYKVLSIFLDAGPEVRWVGDDKRLLGVHVGRRSINCTSNSRVQHRQ